MCSRVNHPPPYSVASDMKRQFLGLLARVYVMQFAMEVPATVAMLAEMLMDYGFQVDIGSVRPLLRALQMEGYLESVLRDGIGRVYLLTELGREELATSRTRIDELYRRLHNPVAETVAMAPATVSHT
ncbi:putative transcriptional regulator (PadR-like family) (plasmid) [Cupriavidus metallidurans CH34]|uniref:Transcriptional regulator (PadR-like family) n=2 Tax=Cupriavidus metallidurans TaxID=119219 RepID=Q1LB68_CUPMC|nr:putative transcriptional regulator (PadR-like family) [Cupriavidus metallidurans CH34]